jgi:hypothetical protein
MAELAPLGSGNSRGGMAMNNAESGRFRVRCRDCGRSVLSGVVRIGVGEANALSAHLETCRPDLADGAAG